MNADGKIMMNRAELEILQQMNHIENIVRILDSGDAPQTYDVSSLSQ